MYEVEFNEQDRVFLCRFKGRLDTIVSIQIASELDNQYSALSENKEGGSLPGFRIIFDLKDVPFISSTFIRICVAAKKRALDGDFSIRNTDPFIKKTFKIAGLDEILNVE
jgi:anti-anti-sigma factor